MDVTENIQGDLERWRQKKEELVKRKELVLTLEDLSL